MKCRRLSRNGGIYSLYAVQVDSLLCYRRSRGANDIRSFSSSCPRILFISFFYFNFFNFIFLIFLYSLEEKKRIFSWTEQVGRIAVHPPDGLLIRWVGGASHSRNVLLFFFLVFIPSPLVFRRHFCIKNNLKSKLLVINFV